MESAALLGAEPGEIVRPTTVEEVAAVVARADTSGRAVIPWGGATAQDYGHPPRRTDILLDLSGLGRILAHEPGDLTITVQAGGTLGQVQRTLAEHGQFLPLDPPNGERTTIGGLIATNAWGPGRVGSGTARDWLIGLTVVDGRGRIVKGGGKVVKNVTGYDLPKLHIGALGTLGVVAEATFKVAPLPESGIELAYRFEATAPPTPLLAALHRDLSPGKSLLIQEAGSDAISLLTAFQGTPEVVENAVERADALAVSSGIQPATRRTPDTARDRSGTEDTSITGQGASEPVVIRVGGCASDALAQHQAIAGLPGWTRLTTFPGTGHTTVECDNEAAADLLAQIRAEGQKQPKATTLLKAPLAMRQDTDCWWPLPPGFALMRRLKETLDPKGILNPGRFIGKL